jgi:P-type Cu+ transporter
MEKVNWKVEGMTCSNCALSVSKVLEKQGMQHISVNPINGDVVFETPDTNGTVDKAKKNIELLGYVVASDRIVTDKPKKKFLKTPEILVLPAFYTGVNAWSSRYDAQLAFST